MSPDDIVTMKLSRTDLVKVCSAALLEELEQERVDAEKAVAMARLAFDAEVEAASVKQNCGFIDKCIRHCGGRPDRLEISVCAELIPGEDIPKHALIIVQDGTPYDYNFRVQLSIPIVGGLLTHAENVIAEIEAKNAAEAASTRKTDMDAKARLTLIADALDSTDEGREALDALKRMRKALKK